MKGDNVAALSPQNNQKVINSYTYDNYRLKTISHNGFNYSFAYDNFGNVTQTKVGSQVLSTNTYGNNNGDLKQVKYGNNDYVDYTYDDYGNISAISQNGTKNFTWQYDSTGNLYSHEDLVNNQRFVYTYDSTGRLVRQQVLNSSKKNIYSSQYGYDLNNNVSRFTSSAGGVSVTENFEYGKDNLASKYTYPSGKTATYTYDGILRRNTTVINTSTPINLQYVYNYSLRGKPARTTKIGWEHINNYIYEYEYDANGNITKINRRDKTIENSKYETQQQFAYDELNQLIRADDLAKNCTEVYNYDNGGNILSTKVYPLTWGSLSGVTATKTTNYTYGDSNWKDKLTAYGSTQLTYDAIGNPLTYRGYTLTWQNGRQLASMQLMQMRIEFTYDVDGLRTSKKMTNVDLTHNYYYVGSRLQYETISDDTALWYFYDADGNPSGIRYKDNSGTVNDYYFVCNWRGDVIQIYNASGTLVGSYTYDAWGKVTENATAADTQGITETNPIRYRGYYYDTETRLYYLKSRYYDPAVKRFLNVDGLVSTSIEDAAKNMFAYCTNNPVFYADSEGNCKYEANSYDFYRMNHGLPAAKCTCKKNNSVIPKVITSVFEEVLTSYTDDVLESIILPNAVLSPLLISEMSDMVISGLRNAGIASLVIAGAEIGWDYYKYAEKDINDFYVSATITLVGIAATAVVGTVIVPALGLTGAFAVGATVIGGVIVGLVEDEAKKHFLN